MDELVGKVAVVTGGASGIGLAMARGFAAEGMRVMLADVEKEALETAEQTLADELGTDRVAAHHTDVRHAAEVDELAQATFARFGTAHVVCNNAGVGMGGLSWDIPDDRWRWVVDVNLMGVVNGIRAFVPRLVEQGEGHVINTASAAGLVTGPMMSPYYATKHAVVALSESLHLDLRMMGSDIGVSVLCPEWVRTGIATSERNRPADVSPWALAANLGGEDGDGTRTGPAAVLQPLIDAGLNPEVVADQVLEAVHQARFWILTHPTTLRSAQKRWRAIEEDAQPVAWNPS